VCVPVTGKTLPAGKGNFRLGYTPEIWALLGKANPDMDAIINATQYRNLLLRPIAKLAPFR
jgi:hypothetical protein